MSAFKVDGTFSTAAAAGAARTSYPIPGDLTAKVISQDYMQTFADYTAPTISTAHGTFSTAYLVGDSELQDIGGGIARFTREWATIPAVRNEWGTWGYQFPGYYSVSAGPTPYSQYFYVNGNARDPFTLTAKSRMYHEYFLCKAGQTYATPDLIPVIDAQVWSMVTNTNARILYLIPTGTFGTDSNPTLEAYLALVAGGAGFGTGAAVGEFVAEASTVDRYMGEIYVRITRYVRSR